MYIYVCMFYIHMYMCVYMYTYMYIICTCVYVCMYICMCVYVYPCLTGPVSLETADTGFLCPMSSICPSGSILLPSPSYSPYWVVNLDQCINHCLRVLWPWEAPTGNGKHGRELGQDINFPGSFSVRSPWVDSWVLVISLSSRLPYPF